MDKGTMEEKRIRGKRENRSRCTVTPEIIAKAKELAAVGLNQDQMAEYFGWARQTWFNKTKKYPELYTAIYQGKAKAISNVWGALYKNAMNGNVVAQIFWLKINAGAVEGRVIDVTGIDGTAKKLTLGTTDPIEASKTYQKIMLGETK